ncbi:MAG: hypothetical protein ACLFT0_12120 [Spirulinaceae cyanobacterium]
MKKPSRRLLRSLFGGLVLWSASNLHAPTAQAAPFECDGTLYISQAAATGDPTLLNDLVTTTTPFTLSPRGTPVTEYNGMGFRVQDGYIYAVNPDDAEVFRIDDTGIPVSLGTPAGVPGGTRYIAGDFNTNTGTYFIYGGGQLVELNVTTSPPTVVSTKTVTNPNTGNPPGIADIAYNPTDGNFYGFDRSVNRIVFFNAAAASPINVNNVPVGAGTPNVTGSENQIGAAFFDAAGNFFAYQNSGNLYRVDLATGRFTSIGTPPSVGQNDGAGCPVAPLIEKIVTPASTVAGSIVTYSYRITNQTDFDLSNITFQDTMDGGRTFTGIPNNPLGGSISGIGTNSVTISNITVPRKSVNTIQLQVQIPTTTPTPTTLFNQATLEGPGIGTPIISRSDFPDTPERPDRTPLDVTPASADVVVQKGTSGTANVGQTVTYDITVTNNGPSQANNVVITDIVDPNATNITPLNGGTYDATTGRATWNIGTLASGASQTVQITVTVPNPGAYTNTATSSSSTPDPNPDNNNLNNPNASATTTVTSGAADVQTTKSGITSLPAPGQASYTITTTNLDNTNTATGVVISDLIAQNATFVSASDGGTYINGPFIVGGVTYQGRVDWEPAITLAPNTSVTRTVTVNLPATGSYTNTASNTSANDGTPGNNDGSNANAQVTTVVPPSGPADVRTEKTGPVTIPAPGQARYTITTTNLDNTNTATNVVISDVIAAGASFVSASDGGTYNPTTRTVTWPAVNIGPGPNNNAVTRTVTVQLPTAGGFTNTASHTSPNDNNAANNSSPFTTTVPSEPDLTIEKSQSGSYVTGQTGEFILTVRNVGAAATVNNNPVEITDTLPTGLTANGPPTGAGWNCNVTGTQDIRCTRTGADVSLAPGQPYPQITVPVNITAAAGTTVTNTAVITDGSGGETNFNNNSDPEVFAVIGTDDPDLTINKTVSGTFATGNRATYTLRVTNVGPGSTTGGTAVSVTDNLPNGVIPDPNNPPTGTGWNCIVATNTVRCTQNNTLASEASYPDLTIPVIVTAAAGADITNSASVAGGGDANPFGNNGSTITSTVAASNFSPFGLAKQVGTVTNNGDGTFTVPFTIVVQNFGLVPITNVQVTDNLFGDTNSTFNGASAIAIASPPTITGGLTEVNPNFNGISDRNLLSGQQALNAGARATINFSVRVTPGGNSGPYSNIATGSARNAAGVQVTGTSIPGTNPDPDGDGNPGNNAGPTPINLTGSAGFRLVKRITGVTRDGSPLPGVDFSQFVDDPNDPDDNADWSGLTLAGFPALGDDNVLQSDDVVEYTIYYLADGNQTITNARICDAIPQGTTFVNNSFSGSSGIQLRQGTTETNLTNEADSDRGQFFSPLSRADSVVPPCPDANNPTGAVFVNLGNVPNTGTNRLGFVRFRVRLD